MTEPAVNTKVNLAPPALRRSFRNLKKHSTTTFGTAAVLCVPLAFVGVYRALRPGWFSFWVEFLAAGLIGILVTFSATVATGMYAEDKDPGVPGLLRRTFSGGLARFFLTSILVTVVTGAAVVLTLIPLLASVASVGISAFTTGRVSEGAWMSLGLGMIFSLPLLVILIPWLFLKLALARPASALSATGPAASLGRSWTLTKGRLWDLFLLIVVAVGLSLVVGGVVAGPGELVSAPSTPNLGSEPWTLQTLETAFGLRETLSPAAAVVIGVSGYLAAVLLTPLSAVLLAEFYLLTLKPPAAAVTDRLVQLPNPAGGPSPAPRSRPVARPDRMVPLRRASKPPEAGPASPEGAGPDTTPAAVPETTLPDPGPGGPEPEDGPEEAAGPDTPPDSPERLA